eukprot:CAMPEP_0198248640 /NCGR_PEP_ID=MMETSP1447-20131203/382_1 /TAXON_ID=420782 /ORGANISM="Chaetoceros dichaeta, Strain CCMP1751" /LENGTH=241 /DNA_ID=CAMNT_0043933103 /DNA_START=35 /DNA_END=760 /DNA_ORIENTATION=-
MVSKIVSKPLKGVKKFFTGSSSSKNKKTTVTTTKKLGQNYNRPSNNVSPRPRPVAVPQPKPVVVETPVVEHIPEPSIEDRQPSVEEVESEEPQQDPEPEERVVAEESEVEQQETVESEAEVVSVTPTAQSKPSVDTVLSKRTQSNDETVGTEYEEPIEESKSETTNDKDLDVLEVNTVDTLHADIKLPHYAKSGDYLDVQHGQDTKTIKVPHGTTGGDEYTVKFTQNNAEEEPTTGAFCCL